MDKIVEQQINEWLGEDNTLGKDIWERKYQHDGETLEEWFDRVSAGDEELRQLIKERKFLFGGRILSNRGLAKDGIKVTYSNCYVLPAPKDNIESIYDTASKLARTFSYGGGVGIDISNLAPNGARVNNTAKETSGAVSFIDLYNLTTGLIGQNGRRGALMISMSCDHPDIEDFIKLKTDLDKATKANLSIRVTDKFLTAVDKDSTYTLTFHREETGETITKEVKAREIFHKFCETNWDYAEPAFLFWDTIEKYNLLEKDENFHYAGTNPCAEEPLPAGGSCLLGSLNLSLFVDEDGKFNYKDFKRAIHIAVRGLNDVLDEGLPLHPLEIQRKTVKDWRQIGLGIMGLADMLIKMKLTYGSEESINVCDTIGAFLAGEAIKASQNLAEETEPYPMWSDKVYDSAFFRKHSNTRKPLRNSQLLTIAPTGTLSTLLGISGGVEPIFANCYTRKTESLHGEDKYYKIFTKIAWDYLQEHGYGEDDSKLPEYFITSPEIHYTRRIRMQSVWQDHIDASISSTVNLPQSATIEDIEQLYMHAWKMGLKGITIFRDGCKRLGILTTQDNEDSDEEERVKINDLRRGDILKVSDDLIGYKRKIVNGCGDFMEQIFFDEFSGEPMENYIAMGDNGGCEKNMEAISRLISLCWRSGVMVDEVVKQLKKVRTCPAYRTRHLIKGDTSKGTSCPSALGFAIEELCSKIHDRCFEDDYSDEDNDIDFAEIEYPLPTNTMKAKCPDCGAEIAFEGGCAVCHECGWSKCE